MSQRPSGVTYGVKRNGEEAVKWYLRSAALDNDWGQFYVGNIYMHADGIRRDDVEAVKWLRLAAEQGHAGAQNNLGLLLWYGRGIASDKQEAVRLWRKAKKGGIAEAQENLFYFLSPWENLLIILEDLRDFALRILRKIGDWFLLVIIILFG